MTRRLYSLFRAISVAAAALPAVADGSFSFLPFFKKKPDFDLNGDGRVRVVVVSPAVHAGGIDSAAWASDLEALIKAVTTDKPARVSLETLGGSRSLMGWWYAPESRDARDRVFDAQPDLLLLAEQEEIVTGYPEFFFEGVRCISSRAKEKKVRTALVLMSQPGISPRDWRLGETANIVYRVGDGCGIEVIPAGFGWKQTLLHNRLPGDSPLKARACAYLTAACCFVQISGLPVPQSGLQTFWATRKTAAPLTEAALEAVRGERVRRHYGRPFQGIVRIKPKISTDFALYLPTSAETDPILQNLHFILTEANQNLFYKTPADWYTNGLDRFAVPFDWVYGDQQQIAQYLDRSLYTTGAPAPTNLPKPCVAVFTRIPEGVSDADKILSRIETLLFGGYDYAKANGLVYVPYPLAWARACQENPAFTRASSSGRRNDWLSYMLASMLYTASSGRYPPTPEKPKPVYANTKHPAGFHASCARIGYQTMTQLTALSVADNAILMRNAVTRAGKNTPCFAHLRLMDKPAKKVQVFCGTDTPHAVSLTSDSLIFTPDTYDIEQTVRIMPATNTPMLFVRFMASAHSDDASIDGKNDSCLLILNFDESENGSFTVDTRAVSPKTGFTPSISPAFRPSAILTVTVSQHGIGTQTLIFTPNAFAAQPFALHPTAMDYAAGNITVTLDAASRDLRFADLRQTLVFRLSREGTVLPDLRLTAPPPGQPLPGPAFVKAAAEAAASNPVLWTALYLGEKRLGASPSGSCSAAVEKGPPQSRLPPGAYLLWAECETAEHLILATPPQTLTVTEALPASP